MVRRCPGIRREIQGTLVVLQLQVSKQSIILKRGLILPVASWQYVFVHSRTLVSYHERRFQLMEGDSQVGPFSLMIGIHGR